MNEQLGDVLDLAVADRAALPLLPHLHRALVATAEVQTVVVHEDAVLGVHHAEAAQPEVAVVDIRSRVFRQRVGERRRAQAQRIQRRFRFDSPLALLRELLDARQDPLTVRVLIGVVLDRRRCLTRREVRLRVKTAGGTRRG